MKVTMEEFVYVGHAVLSEIERLTQCDIDNREMGRPELWQDEIKAMLSFLRKFKVEEFE